FLLKSIDDIFNNTGINDLLNNKVTVEEIITKNKYDASVKSSIKWMLDRLVIDGYINKDGDYYIRENRKIDYNLSEIKEKAYKEAKNSLAAFNMLELMGKNYPDFLSGKKNGVDIMFSPENINIVNEYYSDNLFYNVHNIAGAKILNYDISKRKNPIVVEIGGGMGGGTKQFILQRLKENAPLDEFTYFFTDIANKLLRITKKDLLEITSDLNSFKFQKLNFNSALAEQGYEENSVDVIWGVNAAHVAYDLKFSLTELFKTLKPGGSLIISETVRPRGNKMIQQEFLLNTLRDYWNVKLDENIRTRHGFMEWRDWIKALEATGFVKAETIPDMSLLEKEYDNCYIAVIRGVKP
ncbi:MAG TPA: methyltransferase, partial [Spirochaetota bacterium]|nr:methyltransferase [Spirochaetota bacterium]